MALYQGEDLVDVTTPDGRVMKLPRSLVPASMMPQQIAPGIVPEVGGAPGAPATEMPAQMTPMPPLNLDKTAPDPLPDMGAEQTRPDYAVPAMTPQQIRKEQLARKADDVKKAKAGKAAAAYAATPQGQLGAVQGKQDQAQTAEQQAVASQADVEATEQDVLAHAKEQRDTELDKYYADRATDMQKQAEAEDTLLKKNTALRQKIAGTKIDRTLDHPVLVGLMAALAGIGQAMNQKAAGQAMNPNVSDMIYKIIDRKVAAQEADLDQMAKVYGMSRDELADLKEGGKRKLEFHNLMIAGETDKAARQLDEIVARSASEKTKAAAKVMIAQLQQRAADKTMEATRWGLDYDQKDRHQKQQIALGYAGIAQQKYATDTNAQLRREELYEDYQKALASDRAKGDMDTYKARMAAMGDVQKTGVRDMNGDLYLTPEGRAKMDQAKQIEAQAQALEDKYKNDPMGASVKAGTVQMLRQKASELRGDAQTFNVVQGHNDTEAIATSNMIASGQSVVQLIDSIKDLSDQAGRGLISRSDAQVKLKSMFEQLKPGLKEAWQLGAWDKGSAKLVEDIIGADPTSDWDAGVLGAALSQKMYSDPKAFKGSLDSVAEDLERKAKNKLVNLGAKFQPGDKVLARSAAVDTDNPVGNAVAGVAKGRSGVELQKDAEDQGVVGKTVRGAAYPLSPTKAEEAQNRQSVRYPGLSTEQEGSFDTLLQAYKKGDKQAADELVGMVGTVSKDRPELATALLHNLRDNAPNLYTAARAAVPKDSDVDKQMTYEENLRIGTAPVDTDHLATMVQNTVDENGKVRDVEGYNELARRAAKKDPIARQAIMDIVSLSNNRKLPAGSVFRK